MLIKPRKPWLAALLGVVSCVVVVTVLASSVLEQAIAWWSDAQRSYMAPASNTQTKWRAPFLTPTPEGAEGGDTGPTLEVVASGFSHPTDVQFVPGSSNAAIVLEKSGRAQWLTLADRAHDTLFTVEVVTASEQGLLGLAFHPRFLENGKAYVNYVVASGEHTKTRIAEWTLSVPRHLARSGATETKVLLEVEQPFPNHNAGQLAFGPDGMLYVGFGDGGSANDPFGNGQKHSSLLGKVLRIDVDHAETGRSYAIPKDNPFVRDTSFRPEIWAYGLRNPWRYSFDPKGRLVVADVGQNTWEEIDIVQAGDNLGWSIKEAAACAKGERSCDGEALVEPVYAYRHHDREISITGGYVYLGRRIPTLYGKYVFADFGAGTVYALQLPADRAERPAAERLGRWPIAPSTFGRDAAGELYIADFASGTLFRMTSRPPSAAPP